MHRKAESQTNQSTANQGTTEQETAEARAHAEQAQGTHTDAELDFESLDLSIETVEERISPSETNVFDK